ncbi:MAG TPA: SDR family NAD(P)-dependent oxidoreductase [Sphingomonas sp.]|nr:SDR family NAD(P)-dependent oxidoreductase [Sphingomonas sp.]
MTTLVVGRGGIGSALVTATGAEAIWGRPDVDVTDDVSLAAAAAQLIDVDRVFVTTGLLHDERQQPERRLADITAEHLGRSFLINTIAPSLIAKHVLPRFPRDRRSVFAVLGARVGSIADNRGGGWYGYRASKAALAMLVRTMAIEAARSHPQAIIVALHPGTVDTAMSRPFQRNLAPNQLVDPATAARHLIRVTENLSPADSGGHFAWDGARIPE